MTPETCVLDSPIKDSRIIEARIIENGAAVQVVFDGGGSARFHAVWLRDNALEADTRDPGNGQRLITLGAMPENLRITSADCAEGMLECCFSDATTSRRWPPGWLWKNRYDKLGAAQSGWLDETVSCWDGTNADGLPNGLPDGLHCGDFRLLAEDPASLRDWLAAVRRYGVAKISGGPLHSGALLEIVKLFGFVRETNYGPWFEVRSEIEPVNLAYTGLGLQAHTDNPYRDPVPTLQLLYCLQNSAEGGDSIVVDGFACAKRLQQQDAAAFDLLSRYPARFAYAGDATVSLSARKPLIELETDGKLAAVRFNNRSAAPFVDIPYDEMAAYYAAYRHFASIIDDPVMGVSFKLEPGEAFLVDNTRVLHARAGFSGGGSRWLQGCYADRDGLYSRLACLEAAS